MRIIFVSNSWEDYLFWQAYDKSILKKINSLIKEIESTPYEGNGKPEPLNHNLATWWSRRINLEHRLIYKIDNGDVVILQCRYYY